MRLVLVVILLTSGLNATTYFVKNGGSDAAAGTADGTAWATIAKVNSVSFSAGDIIQFKRGSTWNEATDAALIVSASGSAGNPITYTAYSTGALPILDGQGTVAQGVTASSKAYIVIDSLNIKRNTSYNVLFASCDTCSLTNSTLTDAGIHGVNVTAASPLFTATANTYSTSAAFSMTGKAFNIGSTSASVSTLTFNIIDLSQVLNTKNVSGIVISGGNTGPVITDNTITMAQGVQGIGIKALGSSHITGGQVLRNSIVGLTNACAGCDGEAIELTGADSSHEVQTTTVAYNYCKNGSASADCIGLFWAVSNDVIYNFCIGNSGQNACIHITSSSASNKFYGNNTYKSNYGFEFIGATVTGNDVQNNIAVGHQRGIGFFTSSTGTYDYNISFNNSIANYVGGTDGGHNLTSDPKWASSTPASPSDFALQGTSPALTSGSNLGSTYQLANLNSGAFPFGSLTQGTNWTAGTFAASGINTYFAATSAGAATGADCGNAIAQASITWTAGNNYHACGTLTSALTVGASGSSGNPITITFESGAKISKATCGSTGCLNIGNSHAFIIVDGGTNGIIEATASGTAFGTTGQQVGIKGGTGSSNVEIKNLTVRNVYVRTGSGSDGDDTWSIYWNAGTYSNLNIHNNILTAAQNHVGLQFDCGSCTISANTIHDNTISVQRWGIQIGSGTNSSTATNNLIYNNEISNWDAWGNNAAHHTDGVILYASCPTLASCTFTGTQIYNNYIHGDLGFGSPTAFIFLSSQLKDYLIFNNLLVQDETSSDEINGIIWLRQESLNGGQVYNNTIVGDSTSHSNCITADGTGTTFKNNICENIKFNLTTRSAVFSSSVTASNNNDWHANNGTPFQQNDGSGPGAFISFASWQGLGYDAAGVNSSPNLTGTYHLNAGSPSIGLGANLTSVGVTALNIDKAGIGRPTIGVWDAGAYQFFVSGNPIIRRR